MKTIVLSVLFCFVVMGISAQKCSQIDFDEIYKKTTNKKSPFYLQKLIKRHQETDTTLTPDAYKHLYYGYTRSKLYKPMDIECTELRGSVEKGEWAKAKEMIEKLEVSNPINVNLIYSKLMLANYNQSPDIKKYVNQFQNILLAIMSSGDGKSSETAFVITGIEDEYFLMKLMRLEIKERVTTQCCDIFKIKTPDGVEKTIYFNKEKSSEYIKRMVEKG